MTELIVMRHGETDRNRQYRFPSQIDAQNAGGRARPSAWRNDWHTSLDAVVGRPAAAAAPRPWQRGHATRGRRREQSFGGSGARRTTIIEQHA